MTTSFTRQLGNEAGVQLNPTIDNSEGFAGNALEDQSFATVARLPRGPIDVAFPLYNSNVFKVAGKPEPLRKKALNTAHGQIVEALKKGAKCCVVSRLVGPDAKNKWVVIQEPTSKNDNWEYTFTINDEIPSEKFLFAFKHKGCFSDGIKVSLSSKAEFAEGSVSQLQDATNVTFKIMDKDNNSIVELSGSLDENHVDDYGIPQNIQTMAENLFNNDVEIVLSSGAVISKDSAAYGKDQNGLQKTQVSAVLYPFTEGDLSSVGADENKAAVQRLTDTILDFTYISTAGSTATSLISELILLGNKKNIQTYVDIPNNLGPMQAIAWKAQLGVKNALVNFYWHPGECLDPNGISGRVQYGTASYQSALCCMRNAAKNNFGFANKQQPIAGKDFPIQRVGMKQLVKPTQDELSDLAAAGIIPVIYENGSFIFNDVVTSSGKMTSNMNLTNSVEIYSTLERDTAKMAKNSFMFGPMQKAIKAAEKMLKKHLEDAQTSGWLVPSEELGGKAFLLRIVPNAQRPADAMDITISMHVEGCVRQVFITNTITR